MWVKHKSMMLKVPEIQSFEIHHGCKCVYIGMSGGDIKSISPAEEDLKPLFEGLCHMMKRESGCGEFHSWVSVFNNPIITTDELIRFSKENVRKEEANPSN